MSKSIAAEYQSQPWAMEPTALQAFGERLAGVPESADLFAITIDAKPKPLSVVAGTARIAISGYLLDTVPGWVRAWGINATGYDEIVAQVREAAERQDVTAIELAVNSPGGMVAGVIVAADAIYEARESKPVTAVIESLGASGAYWLASQAETIVANDANTGVGSIGVYTWYVDWTKAEDEMGVKVIVVRSGEHKGMGLDSITESQIDAVQQFIDATADNFVSQVARGRGRSAEEIAKLATGQLWIAGAGRELGLIDVVIESPGLIEPDGANANQASDIQGESIMKTDEEDQAATDLAKATAEAQQSALDGERARVKSLRSEFADDAEFAIKACDEGWPLDKAKAEYCAVLKGRLAESEKKQSAGQAAAEGAEALATGGSDDAEAGGDFIAEARELADAKGISMTAAMQRLNRQKPELHTTFMQKCEANQGRGHEAYAEAV
ncbi:MAG: S49 family peptidase [Thermoguttaceae bacterium]